MHKFQCSCRSGLGLYNVYQYVTLLLQVIYAIKKNNQISLGPIYIYTVFSTTSKVHFHKCTP